jgi:2-oxoisovalerate dehydrogenase E1 component alpha subunit
MPLSNELKKEMFWMMLLSRRLDERAGVLHRQDKVALHISGIGQKAAKVGAVYAIKKGKDWLCAPAKGNWNLTRCRTAPSP